jgi:fibronectin type 3 domain-containing protein
MSLDLDAAGYNVYRATGLKEEPVRLTKAMIKLDKPFYVDSTVQSYRQYFYSVTALDNANNESARSNPIMAMTKDRTPPDPASDVTFKLERHILKLLWKPSPSTDAVGYNVYRGEAAERQPLVNQGVIRATAFADSGYQGKGLIPGRRFLVSLTAVDSARNESKRVTVMVDVPDDEPPASPQPFRAENVEGRYVEVSCGPSQSFDVAAYELYRLDEKKSDTRLTQSHAAPFRYRDTTVTKGVRYRYYAIAVDSAGNRSEKSRIDTILVGDFTPPPSPRNGVARVTQQGVEVTWERVVDFDLDGYVVYRSDIPGGSGIRVSKSPVKTLSFIDPEGKRNNYYTVRAIDTSTNESIANNWVQAR